MTRPVCVHCYNDQLSLKVIALWNDDLNEVEVHEICDNGHYCSNCGGETKLEWIEVTS